MFLSFFHLYLKSVFISRVEELKTKFWHIQFQTVMHAVGQTIFIIIKSQITSVS